MLNDDNLTNFKRETKRIAIKFLETAEEPIRVIAYSNPDSLAAAAILISTFKRLNLRFSLSCTKCLNSEFLASLDKEHHATLIFVGIGFSKELSELEKTKKQIFIFANALESNVQKKSNITYLNPIFFNIDKREVCCAVLAYLFVRMIDTKNEMVHIALMGYNELGTEVYGLRKELFEEALKLKKIRIQKNQLLSEAEPLFKALAYNLRAYIPSISGDENAASRFLESIHIDGKINITNLNEDEIKRLATEIALRSYSNEKEAAEKIYLAKGYTSDFEDFFMLLESCIRFGAPSYGIGICLEDNNIKKEVQNNLIAYKRELITALDWFFKNKENKLVEEKLYVIVNMGDEIKPELLEALTSWLSRNLYQDKFAVFGISHIFDHIQICAVRKDSKDLNRLIYGIIKEIGGDAVSMQDSINIKISMNKGNEFIDKISNLFNNIVIGKGG